MLRTALCVVVCLIYVCAGRTKTAPTTEEVELAITASYARVPSPYTAPPKVLAKLIDSLVSERAKAHATEDVERDRKHVVMWLILLSGWASLDSLEVLTQQLAARNLQICVDGFGATLADVLLYLYSKGHFKTYFAHVVDRADGTAEQCTNVGFSHPTNEDWHIQQGQPIPRCTLLADSMVLRRLRDVAEFRQNIVAAKDRYRLVLPFGYEGVNVFDTRLVASRGKIDGWYHKLPDPATLSKAGDPLQLMVAEIERLTKAQLPEELSDVQVEFVSPGFPFLADEEAKKSFLALEPSDLVKMYLLPNFRFAVPTLASWRKIFEMYRHDRATQLDIANTLSQYGLFYSVNMLGDLCANVLSGLNKRLSELSVKITDVQFLVAEPEKSYGLVTMLFFMQFPELSTKNIETVHLGGDSMYSLDPKRAVVALDDFAGSGKSLLAVVSGIGIKSHSSAVFLSPLVATRSAMEALARLAEEWNVVEVIPGLQLEEDFAPHPQNWMGAGGFSSEITERYFFSFPYMSPDNNCAFAAWVLAPLFTFGARGVKRDSDPPPFFSRFLALLLLPTASLRGYSDIYFPSYMNFVLKHATRVAVRGLSAYLCPAPSGREKFPVVLDHNTHQKIAPSVQRTALPEVCSSRSVGEAFNWALTTEKHLVFGRLTEDNPLQLAVSVAEVADERGELRRIAARVFVHAAGLLEVTESSLEFTVFKRFAAVPKHELELVLQYLIAAADACCPKTMSLEISMEDDAVPPAMPAHFEEACSKGYLLQAATTWNKSGRDGPLPPQHKNLCEYKYDCD